MSAHPPAARAEAARIYVELRSAHLERLRDATPARTFYRHRSYDYDSSLADSSVRRVGLVELLRIVGLDRELRVIELNEPVMLRSWTTTLPVSVVARLRPALRRSRVELVAYCIGVTTPADELERKLGVRNRAVGLFTRGVLRFLYRRLDRVVFGTGMARSMYEELVGRCTRPLARTIEPLPAPCRCGVLDASIRRHRALFVGAFDERKGVEDVLRAWPSVLRRVGSARLLIIGKGPREPSVRTAAAELDAVEVLIDPPRDAIHTAYRESSVVVLPSRRVGGWREQIGLPILEGLAHGCEIVATQETGIAAWLDAHGHRALSQPSPEDLSESIIDALTDPRPYESLCALLPGVDGRIEADAWLFGEDR